MTYFMFLFIFVFIPILILLAILVWLSKQRGVEFPRSKALWWAVLAHVLLALVYTTPWDNYLVKTEVWSYQPHLVTGIVLGYVPIEEYTFFIVETLFSSLMWILLILAFGWREETKPKPSATLLNVTMVVLAFMVWGWFLYKLILGGPAWNYVSLICVWAIPPIALQFAFGADILFRNFKLVLTAIFVPAIYLSLTDIIALNAGTWMISETQTLGFRFFSVLPLEEALFFILTNTLIVFGLTLALSPQGSQRLGKVLRMFQKPEDHQSPA